MKRIMLDVPDLTSFIAITYIYEDEVTWSQMAGVAGQHAQQMSKGRV